MAKVFPFDTYNIMIVHQTGTTLTIRKQTYNESTSGFNFDLFNDTIAVDDCLYFGSHDNFNPSYNPCVGWAWNKLTLNITTPLVAEAIDGVWEYYGYDTDGTGSVTWRTLTCTDNTNKFQNSGVKTVEFDVPPFQQGAITLTGSQSIRVNTPIRFRVTSITNPTEGGANGTSVPIRQIYGIKVTGETVTPRSLYDWQRTQGYNIMEIDDTNPASYSGYSLYKLNASLLISVGAKLDIRNTSLMIGTYAKYSQYALGTQRDTTGDKAEANTGVIQLGEKYNAGTPDGIGNSKNGGLLILNQNNLNIGGGNRLDYVKCYGSTIRKYSSYGGGEFGDLGIIFVDSIFINDSGSSTFGASDAIAVNKLYNFTYSGYGSWYLYCNIHESDDIKIINNMSGILCGSTASLRGVVFRSGQTIQRHYSANVTLTNCVLPDTSNLISGALSTGYTRWIKHYFTYNIKVLDETGTPIEGATIKVVNKDNTQEFTTTTDANGLITEQKVLQYYKEWTKTGEAGEPTGGTLMVDEDYNPFTMTISKTGYETYVSEDTLTTELKTTITLKKAVPILLSDKGQVFLKKNKENQGSGRSLIFNL